jgi:hypothetical protein
MEEGKQKTERGEKREESKKCPVWDGDHASHFVTPDELWTHPAPISGPT